jgi:hypothetical protein
MASPAGAAATGALAGASSSSLLLLLLEEEEEDEDDDADEVEDDRRRRCFLLLPCLWPRFVVFLVALAFLASLRLRSGACLGGTAAAAVAATGLGELDARRPWSGVRASPGARAHTHTHRRRFGGGVGERERDGGVDSGDGAHNVMGLDSRCCRRLCACVCERWYAHHERTQGSYLSKKLGPPCPPPPLDIQRTLVSGVDHEHGTGRRHTRTTTVGADARPPSHDCRAGGAPGTATDEADQQCRRALGTGCVHEGGPATATVVEW